MSGGGDRTPALLVEEYGTGLLSRSSLPQLLSSSLTLSLGFALAKRQKERN